ncbi:TPA: hypothetical protein ACIVXL_004229 [Salmonella enterica subsp. houtenae serovar 1,40:z4,z23:-]|nr:hypothetical protein [Salmonella enterica subsp. houtenae]HCL5307652.1 hypothetical protein [Salmonella enterica]
MLRRIVIIVFLFFSVASVASAPSGLKILSYIFSVNTDYSREIDSIFDTKINGHAVECYKDHKVLLLIDKYYNGEYKLKDINDTLLDGAINSQKERGKVQSVLEKYSDKYIDGFDVIIFHTINNNYVNFYIISPAVNRILSAHVLRNDISNKNILREAICSMLINVPIIGS